MLKVFSKASTKSLHKLESAPLPLAAARRRLALSKSEGSPLREGSAAPPPVRGAPRLLEALLRRKHHLAEQSIADAAESKQWDGAAGEFEGAWRNDRTDGLDDYLRGLGVGWVQRKAAAAFCPTTSWSVTADALQAVTRTPLGERRERFEAQPRAEADPYGIVYQTASTWEGSVMVTTAREIDNATTPVFVTRRWIDGERGRLVQECSHAGVSFRREFRRVAKEAPTFVKFNP